LDITITLLILIPCGLIVIGIVALMIRLDSAGPIFFRQRRVGHHGTPFDMLRFRASGDHE
jgi:putative colanic acid biosynthesis UDP-glucose lipid carrier transferase